MTNYQIENEFLKISVYETGAELNEIKSIKTGKQYLWNGNAEIWGSTSPVLFPVIGAIKDKYAIIEGKTFAVPRHGFVRNNASVKLIYQTKDCLTFQLKSSDETLQVYPFEFEFTVTYTLSENRIEVLQEVKNSGNKEMLFSIGAHPAFKCPVNSKENYEDYYLEFDTVENEPTWLLDPEGLVLKEFKPLLENTRILPLSHALFENDALVFKNLKSKSVSLKNKCNTNVITVSLNDFPYLGIWAKPNGDFVCIEPWLGIADNADSDHEFKSKEGILKLSPSNSFKAMYSIKVEE